MIDERKNQRKRALAERGRAFDAPVTPSPTTCCGAALGVSWPLTYV